jgi:hypothetical protein
MTLHFAPVNGTTGFHRHSPPIQVVAKGQDVIVGVRGCGQGLHVHSHRPGVATASISADSLPALNLPNSSTEVLIKGLAPGSTTITARHKHHTAHLHVHVLRRRLIHVNFYRVVNAAGKQSQRSLSTLPDIVDSMTLIYQPQTNLEFRLHITDAHKPVDLDFKHRETDPFDEMIFWARLADAVPPSERGELHWNVFLVPFWGKHDFCKHKKKHKALATNPIGESFCVLGDSVHYLDAAKVLSHEAGHHFGLQHVTGPDTTRLMYPVARGGTRLSWPEVRRVQGAFSMSPT